MIELIYTAAGLGTRFSGGNKLLADYKGKPLYRHCLDRLKSIAKPPLSLTVITGYDEIAADAAPFTVVKSLGGGKSQTVRRALAEIAPDREAYVFINADQPELRPETVLALIDGYLASGKGLACLQAGDVSGNPCVFSNRYKAELLALTGDQGGKTVINRHLGDLYRHEAKAYELQDIDTNIDMK